jgi:superfamily II DNA/RNA helicase
VVDGGEDAGIVPAPLATWDQLMLPSALRQYLLGIGCIAPTPIQAQLIPALLTGRNCLGIAQTGSGKTLAFLIPMVLHVLAQSCTPSRNPIALVLSPTRELATQTDGVCRPLARTVGLSVVRIVGGVDRDAMERTLAVGAHVCVATPNCFFDVAVVDGITVSCHRMTMVVLDEVDRMLAMGFEEQVRAILTAIRPDRHVAVLSATCTDPVQRLLKTMVPQCTKVAVNEMGGLTLNASIQQHFHCITSVSTRLPTLLGILKGKAPGTVITFVNTHRLAGNLAQSLSNKGLSIALLHGKLRQRERLVAVDAFQSGKAAVLVATEIAARGLDLRRVRTVVNYTMPARARDYVHRIGRTGRAGDAGESHSLVLPTDGPVCRGICSALEEAGLPVPPGIQELAQRAREHEQDFASRVSKRKRQKRDAQQY